MKSFKIEKDVPLPARPRRTKYPFHEMEVGDSFLMPADGSVDGARSAASAYGNEVGKKFTCRQTDKGLRIWRTE